MPSDYEHVRDNCIEKKKKSNKGKISKKEIQECKRIAAIWYLKKHGKPVKHVANQSIVFDVSELDEVPVLEKIKEGEIEDCKLVIPVSQADLDTTDMMQTGFSARASTFIVENLVVGNSIKDIADDKQELEEYKTAMASVLARVYDKDVESDKITDNDKSEFLPSDLEKQEDLMYLSFKLVHVGGNLNKDFFLEEELRKSQLSPILKPLDWRHGEPNIGTIYASRYVEATDNEPGHIKCAAVVYKFRYPDIASEVITRYNNDGLFFSMEVWFKEFECSVCHTIYSWKDMEICQHLMERHGDNSNAYRVLHDCTFAGAGVVENPADEIADVISIASIVDLPDIDFKEGRVDSCHSSTASNKINNKGGINKKMADKAFNFDQDELDAFVKVRLEPIQMKFDAMSEERDSYKQKVDDFETKLSGLESQLKEKNKEADKKSAEFDTLKAEYDEFKHGIEADKKLDKRLAEVVELGISVPDNEAEAKIFIEKIRNVDDDTFDLLKSTLVLSRKIEDQKDEKDSSEAGSKDIDKKDNDPGDEAVASKSDEGSSDIPISGGDSKASTRVDEITNAIRGVLGAYKDE